MAVLVNTSRTVGPDMSEADKVHYTVGIWPFHRSQTIADIESYADIIIGVNIHLHVEAAADFWNVEHQDALYDNDISWLHVPCLCC